MTGLFKPRNCRQTDSILYSQRLDHMSALSKRRLFDGRFLLFGPLSKQPLSAKSIWEWLKGYSCHEPSCGNHVSTRYSHSNDSIFLSTLPSILSDDSATETSTFSRGKRMTRPIQASPTYRRVYSRYSTPAPRQIQFGRLAINYSPRHMRTHSSLRKRTHH